LVWKNWVNKQWPAWGLHNIIVTELKEADIHPQAILNRENKPNLLWLNANNYVAIIVDAVGMKIFGEEAFPNGGDVLCSDHRNCVKVRQFPNSVSVLY
jgi:TATA-binding protein-associated factor